jgi:hypothetical protein
MKTIVLSVENMKEVKSILQPIIGGEAVFAEGDFFDPMHPYMGDWGHQESRMVSEVEHHWMYEYKNKYRSLHHADKPEHRSLFRLDCDAYSCDILHAGDVLYVIDSRTVIIDRNFLMVSAKGKFLKISLVRKFEELTRKEVTDAAFIKRDAEISMLDHSLWLQQKEDEEDERERREYEQRQLDFLFEDNIEEIMEFNHAGEPDLEDYSQRGYGPTAFEIF